MKQKAVKINGTKLEEEIQKRGLTKSGVSLELGHSDTYITQTITRGFATLATVKMLKSMYNISGIEITEDQPKKQLTMEDIDDERLYRIVYAAVTQALKDA